MGGKPGGSCTATLFLKSFVEGIKPKEGEARPAVQWAHLDIGGSMEVRDDSYSFFFSMLLCRSRVWSHGSTRGLFYTKRRVWRVVPFGKSLVCNGAYGVY